MPHEQNQFPINIGISLDISPDLGHAVGVEFRVPRNRFWEDGQMMGTNLRRSLFNPASLALSASLIAGGG